ncbi:MAG: metal ABC transporter permease [Rhizobiales bacterium]|nr:metal ABC transporter permease [Hyphomicrobiales bacterium]
MVHDLLIAPFTEFEFMRRALAGVVALSLAGAPIGVFLMLRRMSLVGDAMAHAILPGAAIGFLLSGLNLFAMTFGGLIAGFAVAILSGVVARNTELKEDAALATFYLASLALGVTIVSMRGTNIDLLHVLFGNILALDDQTLLVSALNATVTLLTMAIIYRPLVVECVDPVFLRTVSRAGAPTHLVFMALVVINLVNGFHALGTLLAGVPSGPAIILMAAGLYVVSVLFGSVGGLLRQWFPGRHLEA